MSHSLRLLLVVCVLWCTSHVAEPAWAHDETAHTKFNVPADQQEGDEGSADIAHIGHHHCPVALHQDGGLLDRKARCRAPVFAFLSLPLRSLAQAPPFEPPAA